MPEDRKGAGLVLGMSVADNLGARRAPPRTRPGPGRRRGRRARRRRARQDPPDQDPGLAAGSARCPAATREVVYRQVARESRRGASCSTSRRPASTRGEGRDLQADRGAHRARTRGRDRVVGPAEVVRLADRVLACATA